MLHKVQMNLVCVNSSGALSNGSMVGLQGDFREDTIHHSCLRGS